MYSKTEAAYMILKEKRRPLHIQEIIKIALDRKLINTEGKTPASTLGADLYLENKRKKKLGLKPRFVKVAPGTWALTEWR